MMACKEQKNEEIIYCADANFMPPIITYRDISKQPTFEVDFHEMGSETMIVVWQHGVSTISKLKIVSESVYSGIYKQIKHTLNCYSPSEPMPLSISTREISLDNSCGHYCSTSAISDSLRAEIEHLYQDVLTTGQNNDLYCIQETPCPMSYINP